LLPLVQLERIADELPVWDVIQPKISAGEFLPGFVGDAADRLGVLEATGTGYPQSHPDRCQSAALTLMHHQQSTVIRSRRTLLLVQALDEPVDDPRRHCMAAIRLKKGVRSAGEVIR